jgi:hypothetical protein
MGSATVPVAVHDVPLRTFSKRIRRDAERRRRDARAPPNHPSLNDFARLQHSVSRDFRENPSAIARARLFFRAR